MITVSELYRHPVKSLTPERLEAISLTKDGRVVGDRVLGFRFRNAGNPDDWSWQTKHNFVGLVNTPALATLITELDENSNRLRIHAEDLQIIDGRIDDPNERRTIELAFTDYVATLPDNPLTNHPERCPVTLVGDGEQPLFHDTAAGLVTLHSEESLAALGDSLNETGIDGRRFRSNIVVRGLGKPFEEMSWVGKRIAIGNTEFKVTKPVTRCLVTHANPVTGRRDLDVMKTLVSDFTPEKPQFAVMLQATGGDRILANGHELVLVDS